MRFPRPRLSESHTLVLVAVAIGAVAGLAAVGLNLLIETFTDAFLAVVRAASGLLGRWGIAIGPVLGGLLAGPLVHRLAHEARGHGVPEVMEAVALRGGRIRPRVAAVKALASAVTIGSGGSAGREGPIVQIGATLGSVIARALQMSDRRTRTLVAAGAAAGIAAAFNAPLAGVFFALEVILQRFTSRGFATVVLSAVTASAIWRGFFGNSPVFRVPQYALEHAVELVFYLGLGVLCAVVGVVFVKVLYLVEDRFDAMGRVPGDVRPALGAVVVGILGVGSPLLLGTGIRGIDAALAGELSLVTLLLLLGGKLVATSFTLGSGASGGVFSPSLFLGAMLGAAYGQVLGDLVPSLAAPTGAYAMVGMAAVFAAAAQAPITSILIVFEMTNDYRIILPLMLACVSATVLYSLLTRDSIYTAKLRRKGIFLEQGRERHLLESIPVARAMSRDFPELVLPASVEDAAALLERSNRATLILTTGDGRLAGVVTADALREAIAEDGVELDAILQRTIPTVRPDEPLDDALRHLAARDLDSIPVVDRSRRVLGLAEREELMRTYFNALIEAERGSGPPPG